MLHLIAARRKGCNSLPPLLPTTHNAILGPVSTPIGIFGAAFSPLGLGVMSYPGEPLTACQAWLQRWLPHMPVVHQSPWLDELATQLSGYFSGERQTFTIPLDLRGTAFQQEIWRTLQTISYGEVWSYGQLAAAIGRPTASRAVGAANARNPVPILVPCHRLVSSSGTLVGYAGGVVLKQRLLQIEGALGRIRAAR